MPIVQLVDVTESAGIRFRHTSGRSGRFYLPETMGAGCAFLEYNNDGRPDLFLVNSSRLPGSREKGPSYPALYRNEGEGRFTDVTREAGLAVEGYGLGVAAADYDGDGFQDLYLTALGPNRLFRNQGNGTFRDMTRKAGVSDSRFSSSAAWFDYDGDGWLDLFVGSYCEWSPQTNQVCPDSSGRKHLCGPTYYPGVSTVLYRNMGDGTFTDVTKTAGLYEPGGKVLGVAVWDPNEDGRLDLVVARDREPNLLYQNNGEGTFSERGQEAGLAYSSRGEARGGMGIETAEVTSDGREAVLIGNFTHEGLALFQADERGLFTDRAEPAGLFEPSLPLTTFGVAFMDYDGDGLKDLFTANGHIDEAVEAMGGGVTFAQKLLAFRNVGGGRFVDVGESLGRIFQQQRLWRGMAVGDMDGDGDPDLLVTSCNGRPALLRNDGGNRNQWLQVKVIGVGPNRDGIGAKVTVTAGGRRQSGWIRSGSSYCSQHELMAFFGLGAAAEAETVEVRFPGGARQTLNRVKARQRVVVHEGKGYTAHGGA
jgi:hypothetical protein